MAETRTVQNGEQIKMQTQETLNKMVCSDPTCKNECDSLYLHPVCHMDSSLEVVYNKATGSLTVNCNKCKKFVAEIAVSKDFEEAVDMIRAMEPKEEETNHETREECRTAAQLV